MGKSDHRQLATTPQQSMKTASSRLKKEISEILAADLLDLSDRKPLLEQLHDRYRTPEQERIISRAINSISKSSGMTLEERLSAAEDMHFHDD